MSWVPFEFSGLAGFPTTVVPSCTSLVTTAPAPITEFLWRINPGRIVAPPPIDTLSSTIV